MRVLVFLVNEKKKIQPGMEENYSTVRFHNVNCVLMRKAVKSFSLMIKAEHI